MREGGLQAAGQLLLRYSLVLVIAWIGAMKFTAFEAAQIQPLVESSPLLRWMYRLLSVQGVSTLFGVVELTAASMIALRPVSAKLAAVGSGVAVMMFLTTRRSCSRCRAGSRRWGVFRRCRARAAF